MKRIEVALGERSYEVLIGERLIERSPELLEPYARDGRLIVVSDTNVWAALGEQLTAALAPLRLEPILVPAGESGKSWAGLQRLCERLIELGVERGDVVVAFGGGMVGDLAGFTASIVKRGCRWVQVPTSLLAQVDSSVGGKTAINAAGGKNLVGSSHQPEAVLIDLSALKTLPRRQLRAGYAEVVKYGLIADLAFFAWCEANGAALIAGDTAARVTAIETSVTAKATIVARDERETKSVRALLNLGHTFGHAIEAETGILHGEAVAIGMALAFRFSAERALCSADDAERVKRHLAAVGLPTALPPVEPARLIAAIAKDKKAAGGRVPFILARGIGRAFVDQSVELSEVEAFLARSLG